MIIGDDKIGENSIGFVGIDGGLQVCLRAWHTINWSLFLIWHSALICINDLWFKGTMNTYFSNNSRKTCIYYWYVLKCALVPCTEVFNVVSHICSDASHLCKYFVTNASLIFSQSSQCKSFWVILFHQLFFFSGLLKITSSQV